MALSLRRSRILQLTLIACAVLALTGPASGVPVTFEAGGRFAIPITVDSVNISGQGLLPLGRVNDPNNSSAVGFDFVLSQVTITKTTTSPVPLPTTDRILSLKPGDPLIDANSPFTADIQSGHLLSFSDLIAFGGIATVTDIDPLKNFAPGVTDPLIFPILGVLLAEGDCVANTVLPNLGCEGAATFDWGLFTIPPSNFLPDIDGNGSPNQFQLGFPDPNNTANPFFFTDGVVTFNGSTGSVSYDFDANSPGVIPGHVNPPFTIGNLTGPITTTHDIVIPGTGITTSVPEPALLTGLGLGAGGLGLLLRYRALRARLKGGRS
jgi:hypothetical protein